MSSDLTSRIEEYLLAAKGWVSGEELCAAFQVSRRDLRAHGDKPGLCSRFAISGGKGFRHVKFAGDEEFEHACRRIRSHGLGELRREKQLRAAREISRTAMPPPPRPVVFERNQALLLSTP